MPTSLGRHFSIEFISVLGQEPSEFVGLTSELGCSRIGLAPSPIAGPFGSEREWTLRGDDRV